MIMKKRKIGVFAGSLRKDSFNKKIARHISALLADRFEVKMMELGELCIFNQDYDDEGRTPKEWIDFRNEVKNLDAVLFVTPEYNRSMPALLKNALDIASRPHGQNCWAGKPAAIAGVSIGKVGAACGVQALKQPLSFLGMYIMPQPEVYIPEVQSLLDAQGNINNERTKGFLQTFADAFAAWVERY
jgi:chromate reductase